MATLTAAARKQLSASQFAGPGRSYPVPDASHAANAKARATQAVKAGRMSAAEAARVKARANAVLKRKKRKGDAEEAAESPGERLAETMGKGKRGDKT